MDVPLERKPERGHIRIFPRNEKGNEGKFACSPERKTGTRARLPKPRFWKTALLSRREIMERRKPIKKNHIKEFGGRDAPEASQGQTRDVPRTPATFGPDLCVNQY